MPKLRLFSALVLGESQQSFSKAIASFCAVTSSFSGESHPFCWPSIDLDLATIRRSWEPCCKPQWNCSGAINPELHWTNSGQPLLLAPVSIQFTPALCPTRSGLAEPAATQIPGLDLRLPLRSPTMDRTSPYSAGTPRRPSLSNEALLRTNGAALDFKQSNHFRAQYPTSPPATDDGELEATAAVDRARLKELNCDRRRPEEMDDRSRLVNMPSNLANQAVTPYLKEHVPTLYAPVSKIDVSQTHDHDHDHDSFSQNFNSKYCYRHRPDLKCRKTADEDKMAMIQSVSNGLALLQEGPQLTDNNAK